MEEMVVVTSKNCSTCETIKKFIAENKSVKIVDVETEEGTQLLKQCKDNGVDVHAVPDCLVIKNGKPRHCTDSEQSELLKGINNG